MSTPGKAKARRARRRAIARGRLGDVKLVPAVEEAAAQPDAPACLVKPAAAWSDFSGPTWDSPIAASVFNLQPRAGPVEPRRAQGWAQRDLGRS